jgi:hypothetical protein
MYDLVWIRKNKVLGPWSLFNLRHLLSSANGRMCAWYRISLHEYIESLYSRAQRTFDILYILPAKKISTNIKRESLSDPEDLNHTSHLILRLNTKNVVRQTTANRISASSPLASQRKKKTLPTNRFPRTPQSRTPRHNPDLDAPVLGTPLSSAPSTRAMPSSAYQHARDAVVRRPHTLASAAADARTPPLWKILYPWFCCYIDLTRVGVYIEVQGGR